MPTLVYPVADVVERLAGESAIKQVGLAVDMNTALATPPRTDNAVYVISTTKGGPLKFTGNPIQQARETTIVLLVWVRNHGDATAVRKAVDALLGAIDARVAGWTPGNPFSSLVFNASRDEFAQAQYAVVQVTYTSSWNFSAQRQP